MNEIINPIIFEQDFPPKIYDSNIVEFWVEINPLYIPNLNGRYWISNQGRICDRYANNGLGKIMPGSFDSRGYLKVTLIDMYKNLICRKIHRLVMMSFYYFPGCEKFEVNHIDGIHTHNESYNLEWCTGSHNRQHAIRNGLEPTIFGVQIGILSDEEVWKIRSLSLQGYKPTQILRMMKLENRAGVNRKTIARIINQKSALYNNNWYLNQSM